uniref:PDZ domain-containing protein n=1 Tax=Coccolithus braarudii TaxID=221442 RepID=A0A7S0Q3R4_9EUKA|mmetsp:Transcript_3170/g.6641  ORF Transcript_3170/g.6641 Transcript_3170/m.6641 type:complete len:247 (+) Transcript_3170:22-762(+)
MQGLLGRPKERRAGSLTGTFLGWSKETPEYLTLRVERGSNGAFGLHLNDHNRINVVRSESAAARAGLKAFDRIIMVDGVGLAAQIQEVIKDRPALLLRVERPPSRLHRDICLHENEKGSTPFTFFKEVGPPASAAPPTTASDNRMKAAEGCERFTVILSRDEGSHFGLEVNADNVLVSVDVNSAADKVGLKTVDRIVGIEGYELSVPLPEVLQKLELGHNLRLTIERGVEQTRDVSNSIHALNAEL